MRTVCILICIFLSGCASIVSGSQQSISVETSPEVGAACKLTNNKGNWFVPATPGSVTVHRSYDDMKINCKKNKKAGSKVVKSSTKAMVFGNAIIGGAIGAAVDVGTGAAYDYPPVNKVILE
jgi:uncharacterized protein YceK